MPTLEFTVNAVAILCFATLIYRLSLIIGTLPWRLSELRQQVEAMTEFNTHVIERLAPINDGAQLNFPDSDSVQEFIHKHPAAAATIQQVWEAVECRVAKDHDTADRLIGQLIRALARNFDRHASLSALATDAGMLFTVIGGMLAFQHIGTSDSPFAAFPSLALAMLTTAAGLVISICVRWCLEQFSHRLRTVATEATDTSLRLAQRLAEIRKVTAASQPPAAVTPDLPISVTATNPAQLVSVQVQAATPTHSNLAGCRATTSPSPQHNPAEPLDPDPRDYVISH